MSLSGEQVRLVKESYRLILSRQRSYSALFYHRLLERHPFVRALFPDDMTHQIEIFRQTIDALVDQVDDLSALQPMLASLACRHVRYGVRPDHYAAVGAVLIDVFEELLAKRFNLAARQAWEAVYAATAGVMIRAAYPGITVEAAGI